MTTLRWPRRSTWTDRTYDVGNTEGTQPFTATEDDTVDIDDEDVVEHYLERGWVRVDPDPEGAESESDADLDDDRDDTDADEQDLDQLDEADEDVVDEADADDDFDLDDFTDQNVGPASDAIAAGDVDDHLGAIKDADDRVTVQEAINERREDIQG